jgi:hypothetical protein
MTPILMPVLNSHTFLNMAKILKFWRNSCILHGQASYVGKLTMGWVRKIRSFGLHRPLHIFKLEYVLIINNASAFHSQFYGMNSRIFLYKKRSMTKKRVKLLTDILSFSNIIKVQLIAEVESKCTQTKLNSIYDIQPHVPTYLKSSSVSQFVFKTYWGKNINP